MVSERLRALLLGSIDGYCPPFPFPFTTQTDIVIPGTTHGLATSRLVIQVYGREPALTLLWPDVITIDPTTYDVRVQFLAHEVPVSPWEGAAQYGRLWQWWTWVRQLQPLQAIWPMPTQYRRIPAPPQSGTVLLWPMALSPAVSTTPEVS